jgi:hypothetical protein
MWEIDEKINWNVLKKKIPIKLTLNRQQFLKKIFL